MYIVQPGQSFCLSKLQLSFYLPSIVDSYLIRYLCAQCCVGVYITILQITTKKKILNNIVLCKKIINDHFFSIPMHVVLVILFLNCLFEPWRISFEAIYVYQFERHTLFYTSSFSNVSPVLKTHQALQFLPLESCFQHTELVNSAREEINIFKIILRNIIYNLYHLSIITR